MNACTAGNAAHEQAYRLHHHEIRRRVGFLGEHRVLGCAEALLRLQASGLSQAAALREVRTQRCLFYVQFIDVAYFPAFQWKHVQLRTTVQSVLDIFSGRTKWQIALWFVEEHPLLEGLRPIELLDLDPLSIARAARLEAGNVGRH